MSPAEWKAQWKRLESFRVVGDRNELEVEWFAQLKHHHIDVVEYGITQLIGHSKDTFMPGLGLLKDYIQQKFDRYDRTHGKCTTCHGSGWIDAPPFKSSGLVYANVAQRCPACGIPAPQGHEHSRREPLTDLQAHEYQAGRYGREQMPDGLTAKHPERGNPELKAALAAFYQRLIGIDRGETA